MLWNKEEKCLQLNFLEMSGYTKVKVTEEDLYYV